MEVNPHALRALRERSGLSVSDLAALVGVSQPHLSNVERGRRGASPALARRLADALDVPLLALIATGSASCGERAVGASRAGGGGVPLSGSCRGSARRSPPRG